MLRRVRLAALADSPAAFGATLEHELALGEEDWRRRTGTGATFLAWQRGEPVGLVTVFPQPGEGGQGEWHLVSMWGSPQVRGSGVARLLVEAAVAQVKAAGGTRLTLWVADGNGRARAFYRRMGFRPTGRRQTYQRRDDSAFGEEELALGL